MNPVLRRLGSGKRWWAAEAVLRALGLALLALCAAATAWLYRLVHTPPSHAANAREFLAALAAVLGWCAGSALLVRGQSLFTLVPVPGGFPTPFRPSRGPSDDRPYVAGDPRRAHPADLRLSAPVRESLRLAA